MSQIYAINGPIIKSKDVDDFIMAEMVYIGPEELLGEVIGIDKNLVTMQVYESSTGLKPGDPIKHTKEPLSVELGPGLLGNIFDGIGRPLLEIQKNTGSFLSAGKNIDTLNKDKEWDITFTIKPQDEVTLGQVIGHFKETGAIDHRVLSTHSGIVKSVVPNGNYSLKDVVVEFEDGYKQTLSSKSAIRKARAIKERIISKEPLITGQRVIDTFFPITKGGSAAIPGGFGAGKTMLQHQLAKWCDADIIVYIGCGERGNEMAQVLQEFSELIDPRSNKPLLDRTILIANTSNMPVAAREASIYTGITFAEYYRDMGYNVALMADSTSRWAEALRELSGRLEEMPAEEGFPAYLASRLAAFYERSSFVKTLGGDSGSISIIGAISPQGADFSEPVTQNTQRFIGCFWALDKNLAYVRHFPAINYNQSYSEYLVPLKPWYEEFIGESFVENRQIMMTLLNEETSLMEIVKLIGQDVLADNQKLTLEMAKVIRVGFLQQNAFHKYDSSVSLEKQKAMMDLIVYTYRKSQEVLAQKKTFTALKETGIYELLIGMKYETTDNIKDFDKYYAIINEKIASVE